MTPEESYQNALNQQPTEAEVLAAGGQEQQQGQEQQGQEQQGQEQGQQRTNPVWEAEAWKDVPQPIRDYQRPFFEKMDRQFQELSARYEPYRAFEQSGIPPERINSAIQLQEALVTDPRGFWEKMAESWGFSPAEGQQLQQQVEDLDPNDPIAQRLAAMEQQLQQRQQYELQQMTQIQQQQIIAQETAKVDQGLASIEQRVGRKLTDEDRVEIVEWALKNAATGRNPDVVVAYYELEAYRDRIAAQSQRQAPRVLGGGGGAASFQHETPKPKTDDDRLAAALNLAKGIAERQS